MKDLLPYWAWLAAFLLSVNGARLHAAGTMQEFIRRYLADARSAGSYYDVGASEAQFDRMGRLYRDYEEALRRVDFVGGMQLHALRDEIVGSGKMTDKQFNDTVLTYNAIPIEFIRAGILNLPLTRETKAEAERVWKASGARRPAYPSTVGSGPNSTVLHYPRSERVMQDGELLLMDMAAEFAHYAADITRTVPVNGRFTPRQREIYDLVLRAQKAGIERIKPGAYFEDIDAAAHEVIEQAGYGDYFIHGLGHFVGLDVHDAGNYQQPLAQGMVITVEPGVYLPEEKLGVRIEDDILVTETGAKVLTDGLPRTPEEIESWLANRPSRPPR